MGARRDLSRADLARLAQLLLKDDPRGELPQILRACVREGSLEPLLDLLSEEGASLTGGDEAYTLRALVELVVVLDPELTKPE